MTMNRTTTISSVEKRMPVTTYLRDTYFPGVETFVTEDVTVDYYKGGQPVAPFVAPGVGGLNMASEGYSTKKYTPPRVAPQKPIGKDELNTRLAGENFHSTMSPAEREAKLVDRDLKEMDDAISRREEVMVAQLLTTGQMAIRGYADDQQTVYVDQSMDFGLVNVLTATGADAWDQATAKPYDDMARASEMVMKAGYNPSQALLSSTDYASLLNNEDFMKKLDVKNLVLATIAPALQTQNGTGLKIVGFIPDLGLTLYVYYAWYTDKNGSLHPYIPNYKTLILPEVVGEFKYGAITQIEEDREFHTHEGTRIPKEWVNVENDLKMRRLSSRPLPTPYDTASWAVINTK